MPNMLKQQMSFKIPPQLKRNVGAVFWLVLAILLIFEGFILKGSISTVLKSQKEVVAPVQNKGVRINFSSYDTDVKRIENAEKFMPSPEAGADPFTGKRSNALSVPTTPTATSTTQGSTTSTGTPVSN